MEEGGRDGWEMNSQRRRRRAASPSGPRSRRAAAARRATRGGGQRGGGGGRGRTHNNDGEEQLPLQVLEVGELRQRVEGVERVESRLRVEVAVAADEFSWPIRAQTQVLELRRSLLKLLLRLRRQPANKSLEIKLRRILDGMR